MIHVEHICKEYKVLKNNDSVMKLLRSMLKGDYTTKQAVKDISFDIDKGEIVGYVGPNGAGKSTTIKMLCGVLVPTSGQVAVKGLEPYRNRTKNAQHIGVVFGQRSQLYWDLPVRDSFVLQQKLYNIPPSTLQENVDLFVDILQMGGFLDQPVRQLSLGQRMRANIAVSMLHNPDIVYLDEPTIGLDILAKSRIREFILEVNRRNNTTFILTTHDMDDIESVCQRLILIDEGMLQYDGALQEFKRTYGTKQSITVELEDEQSIEYPGVQIVGRDDGKIELSFDSDQTSIVEVVTYLGTHHRMKDIHIEEASIESILREMYASKSR